MLPRVEKSIARFLAVMFAPEGGAVVNAFRTSLLASKAESRYLKSLNRRVKIQVWVIHMSLFMNQSLIYFVV